MSGVIPAIPLILVRPFLPESPVWREKKAAGTLQASERRGALRAAVPAHHDRHDDHVRVQLRRGIRRHSADAAADRARALRRAHAAARRAAAGSRGGSVVSGNGRTRRAHPAGVSRGPHREPPIASLGLPGARSCVLPLVFLLAPHEPLAWAKWGIFAAADLFTVSQFSFWGNYIPKVFPTYLRGTGESFAANVGGRMIGTAAALLTTTLAGSMPGALRASRWRTRPAGVGLLVYAIGFVASFWLPEPGTCSTKGSTRFYEVQGFYKVRSRFYRVRSTRFRFDSNLVEPTNL